MDVLNKKGIIFSLSSLFVAAFFMVAFAPSPDVALDAGQESVGFRVNVLDRYSESWERFAGDALRTSGYTALSRMSNLVNSRNTYFNNMNQLENDFHSCLVSGVIEPPMGGSPNSSCDPGGNTNYTLTYWLDEINSMAQSNLSINASYSVTGIDISQQFPFTVTVLMNLSYNITDSLATISRDESIREQVPLKGIRDPLGGRWIGDWHRVISETSLRESDWNKETLINFTRNEEYRYSEDAPSFLMRMIGDFSSSSCCGMESVLNVSEPNVNLNGDLVNASLMDYLYLKDKGSGSSSFGCAPEVYKIDETSIQLDEDHLVSFNISGTDWLSSCG